MTSVLRAGAAAASLAALSACATLGLNGLVRPPHFSHVDERPAELRLGGFGRGGLDVATLRLWARVQNPNTFGLTLTRVEGDVLLDERHAARLDLPLGLPLAPGEEREFPIELGIGLGDLQGLGGALARAASGDPLPYRIAGTVAVDAGPLGQPAFGPLTLWRGDVRVRR